MACRVKPYFFPDTWMTTGGFRLLELIDRSRLGEESRDEGLEDRERGEMGLGWRPTGLSSETDDSFHLNMLHNPLPPASERAYLYAQHESVFFLTLRC